MILPHAVVVVRAALYGSLAVLGVCLLFLLLLLLVAMRRAAFERTKKTASAELRSQLRAALVEFLAGGTDDSLFRSHMRTHPTDISESILLFQNTVSGSARDRLCGLALNLGLVRRWCEECESRDIVRRRSAFASLAFACGYEPCRRVAGEAVLGAVNDDDEEVRIAACRGVIQAGDADQIESLFGLAIQTNLMTRVVLAEDLRRHATALAAGPVREVLRSGDLAQVGTTLEILVAWERAIPLEELGSLLEYRHREVRVAGLRLACFVTLDSASRLALVRSLQDGDAEIRELAMIAAGRQKLTEAIPGLMECLRRDDLGEARRAAEALVAIGEEGRRALTELGTSHTQSTALAASQALARDRTKA